MASYFDNEIDDDGLSKILQPYPQINPRTLFPKFDYVDKPYADILDSIATIFILWSASSIFHQIIQSAYGRTTKSLAFNDFLHQFLNMSFTRIRTLRKLNRFSLKSIWTQNVHIRLSAAIAFIVFIGIDVLVIFSQTSTEIKRGLDSLHLKQLTVREPTSNWTTDGGIGCRLMVQRLTLNDDIPLYYCTEIYHINERIATPEGKVEVYYGIFDDRFFKIIYPREREDDYVVAQLSVQVRDDAKSVIYHGNLTAWGIEMTASHVKWIADFFNEHCSLCQVQNLNHSLNVAKISANSDAWTTRNSQQAYILGMTMIEISDGLVRSDDFFRTDSHAASPTPNIMKETTSGSVKRVSGLILWIVAGVLELIRILIVRFSWDINDVLEEMMAAVLDLPPPDLLHFSPNMPFKITKLNQSDHYNNSLFRTISICSFRLALRRKE